MHLSFADGLFWTSVACCLIAQLFILRSVGGRSHVPEPTARQPRRQATLELFWAVLPAVGLAVLLVFTWRAIHPAAEAPPASAAVAELGQ